GAPPLGAPPVPPLDPPAPPRADPPPVPPGDTPPVGEPPGEFPTPTPAAPPFDISGEPSLPSSPQPAKRATKHPITITFRTFDCLLTTNDADEPTPNWVQWEP